MDKMNQNVEICHSFEEFEARYLPKEHLARTFEKINEESSQYASEFASLIFQNIK